MPARIAIVELPALKLVDDRGKNYTALRRFEPKGSAQIVTAFLRDAGYTVEYMDLKQDGTETDHGTVDWCGNRLHKITVAKPWTQLRGSDFDLWGITINYLQERTVACEMISHLVKTRGRVVVGGSDVFANPQMYLAAGASAVVTDKSGKANLDCVRTVLGDGRVKSLLRRTVFGTEGSPMSPQDWPLPDQDIVKQTLGMEYWEAPLPKSLLPMGAVMLDMGCDRHCSFCQTPTYKIGYKRMTPDRARQWLEAQAKAGARSVIFLSDQFLGRVLWKGGREEVLEILGYARELGLAFLWGNGLELKKGTLGRGFPDGDPTPDEEMVEAIWGWNGQSGCAQAYIPAERPVLGPQSYSKLLPWEQHCTMLEAIVRRGVPDLTYGVIIGLPEDSHASLASMLTAVKELRARLTSINPALRFRITPYAIRPLPGTPQTAELRANGTIIYDDPVLQGGFWTACARTDHLSVEEVSEWQTRLVEEINVPEPEWQGITGVVQPMKQRRAEMFNIPLDPQSIDAKVSGL